MSNLLEFALASNPANPVSVPSYATGLYQDTESYFTFTYTRRSGDPGLQFSLEFSKDLIVWESATPYIETVAPTSFHADGTETIVLRDTRPLRLAKMRFLRLKVLSQ